MKRWNVWLLVLLPFIFTVLSGGGPVNGEEKSKTADSMSGIYEPPCCDGSGYDPPGTVLSEVTLNRPAAGESVTDPTFGTTITALPDGARNVYSQLQVWSYDNKYMITEDPRDGSYVRNADTFAAVYKITRSSPRWIPGTHKIITVDNTPGRIFSYNVATGTEEVLLEFSEYQYITSPISYEELSRDGQWMSLYITNDGNGNTRLLTVNLFEKRVGMNKRLQDMCAPDPEWGLLEPDWIGVSPNGNYAVIQWVKDGDGGCSGMELYDIETGEFVRRVHTHHSHSDLGLTLDGREILVSTEYAHPDNGNVPAIVLYHLDGSEKEYLRMVPWFRTDHISCQGPPGAWLWTAGNDTGNPLLKGELYIIYEDGSLRRLAHHRSDSCGYWAQPKATLSLDGTRIAFSSDWRGNCNEDGGFVIHGLSIVANTTSLIHINRGSLVFGSTGTGENTTENQSLQISNTGTGTLNWTAAGNVSWLDLNPASGTDSGTVWVSVNPQGLTAGTYTGTITVTAPGAGNSPQTTAVTLHVYQPGQDEAPFGNFATPLDGSMVSSSIPVTGWALDDIGVESVKIYRMEGNNAVYIGDAVFVEGARADVEAAYPGYPNNYKAGWGYMMLTNFLPNDGNGTFKIRAVAADKGGRQTVLGTKTIYCDNAHAVKPFGAIDTPTQGGTASGSGFIHWGWALTPQPNEISTDGSTIDVYVDGVNMGHPVYNIYRPDIAGLFPDYANTDGAAGYFYLDTTAFANGVHTIQWSVTDDAGNADGIGSRYFVIQNAGSRGNPLWLPESSTNIPVDTSSPVFIKRGFHGSLEKMEYNPGPAAQGTEQGIITIKIRELERIEIWLPAQNNVHAVSMPVGSFMDTKQSVFYWQPGPGFVGDYYLAFVKKDGNKGYTKQIVRVVISPKTG